MKCYTYFSLLTYYDISIIVVIDEFTIIVLLIIRESLMIVRFLDCLDVLPGQESSECCLDFDDLSYHHGRPPPVSHILILRVILDVIVVNLTNAATTA